MLDILDINSSDKDMSEILELKASFRDYLEKDVKEGTVKHGTVLIINNFPGHELIDYLIIGHIEDKPKNYHRINYRGISYYLDSFVIAVVKFDSIRFTDVDNVNLYDAKASFNYLQDNKEFNNDLRKYLEKYENVWSKTIYHYSNRLDIRFFSPEILVNTKITAENLIRAFTLQNIKQFPKQNRITSFKKVVLKELTTSKIEEISRNIIENSRGQFEYGIITKKKLNLISSNAILLDKLFESIGHSVNIITGKAGTGKTIILLKAIFRLISNGQRARFLTFNNALVKDVKNTLRGYGDFNSQSYSSSTIHSFFFKLSKKLGINLMLSEERVKELMGICEIRFDKFKPTYDTIKNGKRYTEESLLKDIQNREKDESNYPEFREIAKFFVTDVRDFRSWEKIKGDYLEKKIKLLRPKLGSKVFLADYPKVLEALHEAYFDPEKFWLKYDIKNRYDLLSKVYKSDNHFNENKISIEAVKDKVKEIKRSLEWSIIFIDEAQDCEQYEKEILYLSRGFENVVVASGGKEQLIRSSGVRDWSQSWGKKISTNYTKAKRTTYRQKENIVNFVNVLAENYEIEMKLKSHIATKGVGKIILDIRADDGSKFNCTQIDELLKYGKYNGCSAYESLMILVTPNYVVNTSETKTFKVGVTDHVKEVKLKTGKALKTNDCFNDNEIWSGVGENKSELEVPFHNQIRILPYDSCRGLEAWTVMCMDLDGFIKMKLMSEDAKSYLEGDLYYNDEERKQKYVLTWLLMAFTRPMDTLYLDLRNSRTSISKKIIQICRSINGVEILE